MYHPFVKQVSHVKTKDQLKMDSAEAHEDAMANNFIRQLSKDLHKQATKKNP